MLTIVFASAVAVTIVIVTAILWTMGGKAVEAAPRIHPDVSESSVHEARWLIAPVFMMALIVAILLAVSS